MAASKKQHGPGISSLIRDAGQVARSTANLAHEPAPTITEAHGDVPAGESPAGRLRRTGNRIFNVLEYIESSWGLGMNLFPVQRFLVKLYYFLPLDTQVRNIAISDMFNSKVVYRFTEAEYLDFLYKEGRCNIDRQDHERRELLLAIGRRAGKTTLSSIFASYEVYRLLNLENPQDYYGLPGGDRIQIISVATDKDQAGILFNGVTTHLNRCEYFQSFIANNTLSYIQFRTPADIERYGQTVRHENGKFVSFMGKATLRVTFKSCIAKGLRGSGNIVVILDEMAHFKDQGQSSAKDIYDAITPSTAAYSPKDPQNPQQAIGPVESRVICISSPLNKTGKFFDLYHLAMSKGPGSENMIAIQAPTWEVNPTIETAYYRQRYHADPTVFMTEHGAQFSDRVRGWIERETDLLACVDPNLRPKDIGMPRYPHAMGVDVGLTGDGTCIAITHAEQRRLLVDGHIVDRDVIILDYHEMWVAGQDWRETNPHLDPKHCTGYARTLHDVERLDFDEIAMWIANVTKRFYIAEGIFDRWNGFPLEQSLHKRGLTQFKCEMFKRELSSTIYQTTKLLMFDKRLQLYNYPTGTDTKKHSPLIQEILGLQAEQVSRNVVVVEAAKTAGCHDDASDALVRSIWLSAQKLAGVKRALGPGMTGYGPSAPAPMTAARYQLRRARQHGGFGDRPNLRGLGLSRRSR
jgi:hypothetical protein